MNFIELIKSNNIEEAYKLMVSKQGVEDNRKEYNNDRTVRDNQVGNRPDKVTANDTVEVAKLTIPFQRKIVKSAASFLFGSPINISGSSENEEAISVIKKYWKDLRLDALLLKFCETVKSETEATIVLFPVEKEGGDIKLKASLLTNKNGKVYPVIDAFGSMEAFGWEYITKDGDKDVFNLYLWTDEKINIYQRQGKDWVLNTELSQDNPFEKIPVVYLSQDNTEWWEVQGLIDRFENSFSKFADTNDYFAHPTYKIKGAANAEIKKDDSGRVLQMDIVETDKGNIIEADLEVLAWDRAPEALKLEFETTKALVYSLTETPDLSIENVKGLGNISGVALKLLFFGSILKAKWDEGDYQTVIERLISIMISGIDNVIGGESVNFEELEYDVNFTSVLPENIKEIIEILSEATGGKPTMTRRTAIEHNPLVMDKNQEAIDLEEQESKEGILDLGETQI